jgi:acetate kinase
VLALNRGSSSIKFGLFTVAAEPQELARGTLTADGEPAIDQVTRLAREPLSRHPLAVVAHRIVHGGPDLHEPRFVDDEMVATLNQLIHLAPNHLPAEIALIEEVRRSRPRLPQVVCFDTAFHQTLPDVARRLPIPAEYEAQGVRRYGFHGLSYTFLSGELMARSGGKLPSRVILAHLGSGSSLCAVLDGRSIDTSMGFTPIGGVVMGTRSGDIDPGAVTYIARLKGFDPESLERELSQRSGLTGLSGGTSDMRELLAGERTDPHCRLAAAVYCYEVRKYIGAYAAALEGLDALVFSGGIGEHAPVVRTRVCTGLEFLGMTLDETANGANAPVISQAASRVAVHVIPTDEELVLARAACQQLERHA